MGAAHPASLMGKRNLEPHKMGYFKGYSLAIGMPKGTARKAGFGGATPMVV